LSVENARRFIEVASQDQALQKRLAGQEPAEALRLAVDKVTEAISAPVGQAVLDRIKKM
jgi:hypothetical protein